MFCSKCGKEINQGDSFCGICGARTKSEKFPAAEINTSKKADLAKAFSWAYLIVGVLWLLEVSENIHAYSKFDHSNYFTYYGLFWAWVKSLINAPMLFGLVLAIAAQILVFTAMDSTQRKALRNIAHEFFLVFIFYLFLSIFSAASQALVYAEAILPSLIIIARGGFNIYKVYIER